VEVKKEVLKGLSIDKPITNTGGVTAAIASAPTFDEVVNTAVKDRSCGEFYSKSIGVKK